MESFLTAVADLAPSLQQHRAKFSFIVTFCCFLVGSAFCMEGGFHTFKVSLIAILLFLQKFVISTVLIIFELFRFLTVLVHLVSPYCGYHFGRVLQLVGVMVVIVIFVILVACVKRVSIRSSNTASSSLHLSSQWYVRSLSPLFYIFDFFRESSWHQQYPIPPLPMRTGVPIRGGVKCWAGYWHCLLCFKLRFCHSFTLKSNPAS